MDLNVVTTEKLNNNCVSHPICLFNFLFYTCTCLPFSARWTLLNEGLHALLWACLPGNDKSLCKMHAVNKLLRDFFSLYGLFYPSRLHHVLKGFPVFRKLNYGEKLLKFSGKLVIELRIIMNWSFVSHKRFSCSCFQSFDIYSNNYLDRQNKEANKSRWRICFVLDL